MLVVMPLVAAAVLAGPMQVQVRDAHVAAAPAGSSVAISALVTNPGAEPVMLVGASSPLAGQTVMQRYVKDAHGLVQLQALDRLPLPPKSETVLAPGALELQLVGLTQELKEGLELPLTLKFADGTVRTLRLEVEGNGQ